MADWKVPVSYNFNPSYHAYAYGLLYPTGSEQTHPNMNWPETTYTHPAVNGGYYQTQAPQQSPPGSPEPITANSTTHYQGPVLYFSDTHTQNGRLFLSQNRNIASYEEDQTKESIRPSSDTPSDSEAHTPDSWSSGSSREGCVPPENPTTWVKKESDDETESGSPDCTDVVSSSFSVGEDDPSLKVLRPGQTEVISQSPATQTPQSRKAKVRTAFSEGQMNALTHRFSMQKYLTPAEMKTLAGFTGLTYKQVKTWFQNRRMKLKRHQKENGWVNERYANNGYPGVAPTPLPQFQADAQTMHQDLYSNQQLRETVFKKSPPLQQQQQQQQQQQPQHTAFYPNYMRAHSPTQASTPRPQSQWRLPPPVTHHYEYPSPANFMPPAGNTSIDSDDGTGVDAAEGSPTHMAMVHSATQWSS